MFKSKCPHCGEEIKFGLTQKFIRSHKWLTCPACNKKSTFDNYSKLSKTWSYIIAISTILLIMVTINLSFLFDLISKFVLLLSVVVMIYVSHLETIDLKKVGHRKTDNELKKYFVERFQAWGMVIIIFAFVGISLSVLEMDTVDENITLIKEANKTDNDYKTKLLTNQKLHQNIKEHLVKKSLWENQCATGESFYCRLASRIAFYEGDEKKEKDLLEKACTGNDSYACYRLYRDHNQNDEVASASLKETLIQNCLQENNNKDNVKFCNEFGLNLLSHGEKTMALKVFKNQCENNNDGYSCYNIVRKFSFTSNHEYHESACNKEIKPSCEALKIAKLSVDREIASAENKEALLIESTNLGLVDSVEKLILSGEDVNTVNSKGRSLLHIATRIGNLNLVKSLIKNGANVNTVDKEGATPLMDAVYNDWNKEQSIFTYLIKNGAEVNISDNYAWTVLDHSVEARYPEYFNLLVENVTLQYLNQKSNTVTRMVENGYYQKLEKLFSVVDSKKIFEQVKPFSLVKLALQNSSKQTLEVLFNEFDKQGIDLTKKNDRLVELANQRGDKEIIAFMEERGFAESKGSFSKAKVALHRFVYAWQVPNP